jgi:hypothetical protein
MPIGKAMAHHGGAFSACVVPFACSHALRQGCVRQLDGQASSCGAQPGGSGRAYREVDLAMHRRTAGWFPLAECVAAKGAQPEGCADAHLGARRSRLSIPGAASLALVSARGRRGTAGLLPRVDEA